VAHEEGIRLGKDVEARRTRVKELMVLRLGDLDRDVKVELTQEPIPLGLVHVGDFGRGGSKVLP
jgi:hypothetical protein